MLTCPPPLQVSLPEAEDMVMSPEEHGEHTRKRKDLSGGGGEEASGEVRGSGVMHSLRAAGVVPAAAHAEAQAQAGAAYCCVPAELLPLLASYWPHQ